MVVKQKEKTQNVALIAWLAWGCAALFFGYQFAQRVSPSVMTNELMASFGVRGAALGMLSSWYYYAYSFLQVPAGSFLDRFGPRKMLMIAISLCVVGSVLFASSTGMYQASLGRFFIGAGSAFGFLSCLKIGTLWFSPERLPMIVGLSLGIGTLGAVGGSAPLSKMVQAFGWENTSWILAAAGFFLLGMTLIFVKEKKSSAETGGPQSQNYPFLEAMRIILVKPQTWLISLYGILMYVPLAAFADMWGTKYLMDVYHMDCTDAAAMASTFYIGLGVGAPLVPLLANRWKSYRLVMALGTVVSIATFGAMLFFTSMPLGILTANLFLLGFSLAAQVLCFSMVCNINPREISGTVGGFHNMVCMISGVIFIPLIGWILDQFEKAPGVYTIEGYTMGLGAILVAMVAGLISLLWMKEAYYPVEDHSASGDSKMATEKAL